MNPSLESIFEARGDTALRALLARRALVAFDFDGTLAPIVELPPLARLDPAVESALRSLAERVDVAIVSGRGLADLHDRISIDSVRLLGNHGNDELLGEGEAATRARDDSARWRKALQRSIDDHFGPDAGVEIEDKHATLSVHYRRARDPQAALHALNAMIAALEPAPRTIGGKFVINVLPPTSRTKFEALRELADEIGAETVAFVGDDVTDELVFEAAPDDWLTVRVEPEGPTAARFSLSTQREIVRLIQRMLALLETRSS